MSSVIRGVDLIAKERGRQLKQLGYSREDDLGREAEMASAALCYITTAKDVMMAEELHRALSLAIVHPQDWPWDYELFKPSGDVIRDLVRAGALIAAAIDAYDYDRQFAETNRQILENRKDEDANQSTNGEVF